MKSDDLFLFGALPESVIQIGYLVEDIDQAMMSFTAKLNIGPWHKFRISGLRPQSLYKGEPTAYDISIALTFQGTMMFELVQQHDAGASVFHDAVARRGYGLHHWGIGTRRFEERLAEEVAKGATPPFTSITGRGARIAYMEGPSPLYGMMELIEVTPENERFYASLAQRSSDWDGQTLVTP